MNHIEQGIQQAIEECSGGGDASNLLLWENDAVNISQSGASPIVFGQGSDLGDSRTLLDPQWFESQSIIIEVDGEEAFIGDATFQSSGGGSFAVLVGIRNPGDSQAIVDGAKAGAMFEATYLSGKYCFFQIAMMMLDSTKFPAGTHSIRIYKEITA